jgi:hypothetical protein
MVALGFTIIVVAPLMESNSYDQATARKNANPAPAS